MTGKTTNSSIIETIERKSPNQISADLLSLSSWWSLPSLPFPCRVAAAHAGQGQIQELAQTMTACYNNLKAIQGLASNHVCGRQQPGLSVAKVSGEFSPLNRTTRRLGRCPVISTIWDKGMMSGSTPCPRMSAGSRFMTGGSADPTVAFAAPTGPCLHAVRQAAARCINPADIPSTHGYMNAAARPLFNFAMNSKSLANEPNNATLRSSMIVNSSAFVLFSDVRYRSDDLPYYVIGNANQTDLATPHCYTTRFSARHNNGGEHHLLRRSCGLITNTAMSFPMASNILASAPAKIPANR